LDKALLKTAAKFTIAVIIIFSIFGSKLALSNFPDVAKAGNGIALFDAALDIIPFSNVKAYKRWNEEDISWKAWFRRGYTPIVAFLASAIGIVFILLVNIFRLSRLVRKNFKELWEAEENYYRLLEAVDDAVILMNSKDGHILEANHRAEALSGYSRIDLLDMNIYSLLLKSEEDINNQMFQTIEEEDFIRNANLNIITIGKSVIKTRVNGRLIKGYNKTTILLTLLVCD
jgi:PAS domain S-box-containing protein